jgi:acetyl-CoA carboxylase carboxyl transferase subunit beta
MLGMIQLHLFKKRKYITVNNNSNNIVPIIPDGICVKCDGCKKIIYTKEISNYKVCPYCESYFRISAKERIDLTCDENTFVEINEIVETKNPINYPGYEEKLLNIKERLQLDEAVVTGHCSIDGNEAVLCVMDSNFIMGSMGCVVGEKITRSFEYAIQNQLPVIIFTASGGARMQEGIYSLMQMAKISGVISKFAELGLLYISILTDPTTGGVMASFAMDGDIILAEPKALVAFAGRRVIEQTIKEKLPSDFQTSEFLLEHGFVDKIVTRFEMKYTLAKLLKLHKTEG